MNKIEIPFKFLPFLYFLSLHEIEEIISQIIGITNNKLIVIDEN